MVSTITAAPPALNVIWYDSAEAIHRAMWEPAAKANGMTYEELVSECEIIGFLESGEEVTLDGGDDLDGMRVQGCWGFVSPDTGTIHAWADANTDPAMVIHMLAHEIGHATGVPMEDELQEELRAEQFGKAARMAFEMLTHRPNKA